MEKITSHGKGTALENSFLNLPLFTNKTLKLANYVIKAEHLLLYNALVKNINEDSTDLDYIMAFHKDVNDTSKAMEDAYLLLSTVDENGHVKHIEGKEQNLNVIFGDAYNQEKQTIKFPFGEVALKEKYTRDDFKDAMILKCTGLNRNDYDRLYKIREKVYSQDKTQLYTFEDKVQYLVSDLDRQYYDEALSKIKDVKATYTAFRRNLSLEERAFIAEQITFDRSMIDMITKSNSYITVDGIQQIGAGQKKNLPILNEIQKELVDNPYVDAIELDKSANLSAIIPFLKQVRNYKFNLDNKVILKIRPLGNYNANGLAMPSENLVALDIKNASAGVHEFIHLIKTPGQEKIAHHFRNYLDLSGFTISKRSYYNSTSEIISRLGEITALLEEYKFDEDIETITDFANRVRKEQDSKDLYDFNMTKKIDFYLSNKDIYFDLPSWNPGDYKMVKNFYRSYMRVDRELEIEPNQYIPEIEHKPHRVIGERTRYEVDYLSQINSKNIRNILDVNEKEKMINPTDLIIKMMSNPWKLNRTRKNISNNEIASTTLIFNEAFNWITENKRYDILKDVFEFRLVHDLSIDTNRAILLNKILKSDQPITELNSFSDDKLQRLDEHFNNAIKNNNEELINIKNQASQLRESIYTNFSMTVEERKEISEKILSFANDATKITKPLFNELKDILLPDEIKSIPSSYDIKQVKEIKNEMLSLHNAKGQKVYKSAFYRNVFKHVDLAVVNAINNNKTDFLKLYTPDDLAPVILASTDNAVTLSSYLTHYNEKRWLFTEDNNKNNIFNNKQLREDIFSYAYKDKDLNELKRKIENVTINVIISDLEDTCTLFSTMNKQNSRTVCDGTNLNDYKDVFIPNCKTFSLESNLNNLISIEPKIVNPDTIKYLNKLKTEYATQSESYSLFEKNQELELERLIVEAKKKALAEKQETKQQVKVETKNKNIPSQKIDSTKDIDPNELSKEEEKRLKKSLKRKDPNQISLF